MKMAIISDIHGNITALDAVQDDLRKQNVEAVYCVGDLGGYAPSLSTASCLFDGLRRR